MQVTQTPYDGAAAVQARLRQSDGLPGRRLR
jgi:hypothetical protein